MCAFPYHSGGCDHRFCDAHHITHWADGGPTSLPNLMMLCRFHHRRVHEDGYTGPTTAMSSWHGERLDLGLAISLLRRRNHGGDDG